MVKTKKKTRASRSKNSKKSLLLQGRSFNVLTLFAVAAVLVGFGFIAVRSWAAVSASPSCTMSVAKNSSGAWTGSWRTYNLGAAQYGWDATLTNSATGNTTNNVGINGSTTLGPRAGYINTYILKIYDGWIAKSTSCSASIDLRASDPSVPSVGSSPTGYESPPGYTSPDDSSPATRPSAAEESQPPADDVGWIDSGDASYDPYAGYATMSDDGDYEALLSLGEVSLEDLSNISDERIQEIIETKTRELKAKKASGSSADVINRAYAGKLKLLPPGQAMNDGPDQVNYYINAKLKAKVKKSPFSYTLDTTRLKNGRYALTIVPYQNGEKLGEYSYGITIKNKLNFWQQILNVVTSPFSR